MQKNNLEKKKHPGVSGKNGKGGSWFNSEEYHRQRELLKKMDEAEKGFAQSTGANLVGRSDLKNQGYLASTKISEKEIFEALKRSPEVDVSDLRVYFEEGVVTLAGSAEDAEEARAMGKIVQNIPGVSKVIDHLYVRRGPKIQ